MSSIQTIDLKEIIDSIIEHHSEIIELYLFGSRAYETNSLRSDFDILAISDEEINKSEINDWLHYEYPMVDIFTSDINYCRADSAVNSSVIKLREGYKNLIEQLDAILLWNRENGYNEIYKNWNQKVLKNIDFKMSIIPSFAESTDVIIRRSLDALEKDGLCPFFSGSSYSEISQTIIKMVSRALSKPSKWAKKASNFNFDKIIFKTEYDFQNFIHLILKPVFPDIESEPFEFQFDSNKKYADFSICRNHIVLEAKWIDTTSKKNDVLKEIEGLKNFYIQSPNLECLIFLILYDTNVTINEEKIKSEYAEEFSDKPVYIELYKNIN